MIRNEGKGEHKAAPETETYAKTYPIDDITQCIQREWPSFTWTNFVLICLISMLTGVLLGLMTILFEGESQASAHVIVPARPDPVMPSAAMTWDALADMGGVTPKTVAGWDGSLPMTGTGRILILRVAFPTEAEIEQGRGFQPGDSLEALQALIGKHIDGTPMPSSMTAHFPYESLNAYYLRSSYGKLDISGEAYDYGARFPRDAYGDDIELLFMEALHALDDDIDYTDYDGDNDGTIDCVCIRFAGKDTGWDTTWWSYSFHADGVDGTSSESESLDGMTIDTLIMLHNDSASPMASRTLIHECGHAMGIPDYYSETSAMSSPTGPNDQKTDSGIDSFDMMNDNMGDHNGFSKWMLGWIDDGEIAKATCDASGQMRISCSGAMMTEPTDGMATVTLGAFSDFEASFHKRMLAIYPLGDDGSKGPLADFYLLQYDPLIGNQSINGIPSPHQGQLPSGFRLFHVRSVPSSTPTGLLYDNFSTFSDEPLIELVTQGDDQGIPGWLGCDTYLLSQFSMTDMLPRRQDPNAGNRRRLAVSFPQGGGFVLHIVKTGDRFGTVRVAYVP